MSHEIQKRGLEHGELVAQVLLERLPHDPSAWTIMPRYEEISGVKIFTIEGISTKVSLGVKRYEVRLEHFNDTREYYGLDYRIKVAEPQIDTINWTTYYVPEKSTMSIALHLLYGRLYVEHAKLGKLRTEEKLREEFEEFLFSDK